jgi:hypothetical protein
MPIHTFYTCSIRELTGTTGELTAATGGLTGSHEVVGGHSSASAITVPVRRGAIGGWHRRPPTQLGGNTFSPTRRCGFARQVSALSRAQGPTRQRRPRRPQSKGGSQKAEGRIIDLVMVRETPCAATRSSLFEPASSIGLTTRCTIRDCGRLARLRDVRASIRRGPDRAWVLVPLAPLPRMLLIEIG